MNFFIKGKICDESYNPISGIFVEAYDSDIGSNDYLGITQTDDSGNFELTFPEESFKGLFERNPDIYFVLRDEFQVLEKTVTRSETKHGEFFNLTLKESVPLLDIYSSSGTKGFSQFMELGDSVDLTQLDLQALIPQLIRSLSSWAFYTQPETMRKYGHPGPQVPRYPKKHPNHSHSLPWT